MNFFDIIIYFSIFVGFYATFFYLVTFFRTRYKVDEEFKDSELPFVSVVIPAFNEENSVRSTLNSILSSDYPKFEVLFVDDGSEDKTFSLAKSFKDSRLKVFTKKNGGKATALNYGIFRALGEIIVTMDADTFVHKDSLKKLIKKFKDETVACVTPAMLVKNSKGILGKVQQVEYSLGIFLRKVFSELDAVYVAPGAFSAYRKSFFDKHGGFDEGNLTEDLEMSLRIQSKNYRTKNCVDAPAYTLCPTNFKALLNQRVRWYWGLMVNFWNYRKLMNKDYGDLGMIILPVGWITIFFTILLLFYMFFNQLYSLYKEFVFWLSVRFDLFNPFDLNLYAIEKFFYLFFSNPLNLFSLIFIVLIVGYLAYSFRKVEKNKESYWNIFIYLVFFGPLFVYWWVVAIFKLAASKKVSWR